MSFLGAKLPNQQRADTQIQDARVTKATACLNRIAMLPGEARRKWAPIAAKVMTTAMYGIETATVHKGSGGTLTGASLKASGFLRGPRAQEMVWTIFAPGHRLSFQ